MRGGAAELSQKLHPMAVLGHISAGSDQDTTLRIELATIAAPSESGATPTRQEKLMAIAWRGFHQERMRIREPLTSGREVEVGAQTASR